MKRSSRASNRGGWATSAFEGLASSKLALALVALLILLSAAGAMIPQTGLMGTEELAAWQDSRPSLTRILRSLGLFHVFSSWPFFATILLLGANTLTCTMRHLLRDGGLSSLTKPDAVRRAGFLLVHLSLLTLMAGAFWSAAAQLQGLVVLTEGQSFTEEHDGYSKLLEAPFRPERHQEFVALLKDVRIEYEQKRYPVDVASSLDFLVSGRKVAEGVVRVNEPFTFQGVSFTQDKTGFSPRLVIREKRGGRTLVDSFVALQTFGREGRREYRDYLPFPFFQRKVVLSLYPAFSRKGGEIFRTGEEPENPLLVVEAQDASGKVLDRSHLPMGGRITLGEHTIHFADLRRWSALRIAEDPGYPLVVLSLWLGVVALLMRYGEDLWTWFGNGTVSREARETGRKRQVQWTLSS